LDQGGRPTPPFPYHLKRRLKKVVQAGKNPGRSYLERHKKPLPTDFREAPQEKIEQE